MDQHMSRRHFMKVAAGATALATSVEASASLLEPTTQVASAAPHYVSQPTNRVRTLMNAGWQFIREDVAGAQATTFNDSSWKQVNLPHSFDTPYFQVATWYQGYGWYRRHFPITANQKKGSSHFAGIRGRLSRGSGLCQWHPGRKAHRRLYRLYF